MTRLTEKKLKGEMQRPQVLEAQILATADHQISLTDPDARAAVAQALWGYHVQVASILIITHEVTDIGTVRSQLANVATKQTKGV
jgi:hypothetical protein